MAKKSIEIILKESLQSLNKLLSESDQLNELGSTGVKPAPVPPTLQAAPQVTAGTKPVAPITWQTLYQANKAVIGKNPNNIRPGTKLTTPDGGVYTVAPGDNLSKIAAKIQQQMKQGAKPAGPDPDVPQVPPQEEPAMVPDPSASPVGQVGPTGEVNEKPWSGDLAFQRMLLNPPTDPVTIKSLQSWLNARGVQGLHVPVTGTMDAATQAAMKQYQDYMERAIQNEGAILQQDPTLARIIELARK